jgi:tetratricopeptide (TPR) repeat protein
MIPLLISLALAQEGVDQVPADAGLPGWAIGESAPPLFDVDRTIDEAIDLRRNGDVAGSATLLAGIVDLVPPERRGWYLYQRGIAEELRWHFAEARAFYEQAIAAGGDPVPDARFRLALVLEDLGDPQGALAQMQILARERGFDEDDQLTVALQTGISEVDTGHRRSGVRTIESALAALEGTESHTWLRAKARYALAQALLAEADALALHGSQRKVVRRLKARVARITAAESQITALVYLKEPEWIVASMILLGDAWRALADALETAPPPASLTPEQVVIYQQNLDVYAENARTKAFHYWDQGVEVANRLGFESPKVQVLKDRRNSLPR